MRPAIAMAVFLTVMLAVFLPPSTPAQDPDPDPAPAAAVPPATGPSITLPNQLTIDLGGGSPRDQMAMALRILAGFTILTLAPSILIMMTSFTRIVVVLSFVRRAVGVQEAPPTQIILGLALFLTFFTMAPTWNQIHQNAILPYLDGAIDETEAYDEALGPIRSFMFANTRRDELRLLIDISRIPAPQTPADVPSYVLMPAFMLSEIKTAFIMGFMIFLPFLVIDMVVASILLSMGMMMLPPVIVSLPFKIILFVLVDGWALIVGSILRSYM